MANRKSKKEKVISMPLKKLLEMEQEAVSDRVIFIDLLEENLAKEDLDYRLLEMLCDGMSVSNKLLREVSTIASNNPIFKSDDLAEEQVVLFNEDQHILEMIVTSRAYMREDLRSIKNISTFLH